MKIGDIINGTVTDTLADGRGVVKLPDEPVVFADKIIKGDIAEIKITKTNKNIAYGDCIKLIKNSPDRIKSQCPVSDKCGGCSFRNMKYSAQLAMKYKIVADAFRKNGHFDILPEEILSCENPDRYRNKAQYPFAEIDNKITCGFYESKSHKVVPCDNCLLEPEIFSEIRQDILKLLNNRNKKISVYSENTNTGILRHLYIRQGYNSGEIMVCFVCRKNIKRELAYIVKYIINKYNNIKSVFLNINPEKTNKILDTKKNNNILLYGKEYIKDTMCGLEFDISPLSFYQVNTPQAEKLYKIAKDFAAPDIYDTLLDFYCGTGTIGLSMAHNVKKLVGIEIIPDAIENAKQNAIKNNIKNAEFICSDSVKAAEMLIQKNIHPDIIVVDPPRKGCSKDMLKCAIQMSPKKIVMISCNPQTAARDARILADGGYELVKYKPVDMFPQTGHIETVLLMTKK